ncbi:TIGR03790 family protein [Chitinibacteraceae bacterium HSL-7]
MNVWMCRLTALLALLTPMANAATYRLDASQLLVVARAGDAESLELARYYLERHGMDQQQLVVLDVPDRNALTRVEFDVLQKSLAAKLGPNVQAIALAWTKPFRVDCQSITSALTLGYDPDICAKPCGPGTPSPYFNHASTHPYTDLGIRPSMLLAGKTLADAKAVVDRGAKAWGNWPEASAFYLTTSDKRRSSRAVLFPPSQTVKGRPLRIEQRHADVLETGDPVLIYQTGLAKVAGLNELHFVPGALADHLTSFGGVLIGSGQMSSLEWLSAGATASYGTVSEPCSYPQKFPHPTVLLTHYLAGATALEAYWKSVAWPAQGVFIGDPLAAPYRRLVPLAGDNGQ